jgi:hypothetical protein
MWQLLHHLIAFRHLGLDVYYIEDNCDEWVFDPYINTKTNDPISNVQLLANALESYGFGGRWAFFFDEQRQQHYGMESRQALQLLTDADAIINLCAAVRPRDEYLRNRCLVYLETDPGDEVVRSPDTIAAHAVHFTYGYNIGAPDCLLPAGDVRWHRTRPPVSLDQWSPDQGLDNPVAFTTIGVWESKGRDIEIAGETYYWSKHFNFRKLLDVPRGSGQYFELATDLNSGSDYEQAMAGGYSIRPAMPMSMNIETYRQYILSSRGEFTAAKDRYVRTRSGWFSDRSVCYLAAGRPVITQRTGFEKFIPIGVGLLAFDDAEEATDAVRAVNADYSKHAKTAREIAYEYFDGLKLLDEIAQAAGL